MPKKLQSQRLLMLLTQEMIPKKHQMGTNGREKENKEKKAEIIITKILVRV